MRSEAKLATTAQVHLLPSFTFGCAPFFGLGMLKFGWVLFKRDWLATMRRQVQPAVRVRVRDERQDRTGQEEDLFVLDAAVPGLNKVREREAMRGAMEGAGGVEGGHEGEPRRRWTENLMRFWQPGK